MIRSLSYIGFNSPNAEKWLEFGPEIFGLEVAGRGPDGAVRLRVDDAVHRIAVHPGASNDLAYLGWCVGGPAELESASSTLEKATQVPKAQLHVMPKTGHWLQIEQQPRFVRLVRASLCGEL